MTPDINVLVAASRADHPHHRTALKWLKGALAECTEGSRFVLLPMVTTGFLRLVTHPKVFVQPTPIAAACAFLDAILSIPGVTMARLGDEWNPLQRLCCNQTLTGNAIPDAWIAAAVKTGGVHLVTFDRDFAKLLGKSDYTLLSG